MRRVVAAAFAALLLIPATADAFQAGAAVTDITPPKVGTMDPPDFVVCPAALFSGPRTWAFDEPYQDLDASGAFSDGDPYCDANLNHRHDQIWYSGAEIGAPVPAKASHDPITARAFAIGDGTKTLVTVSVVAQGLFNTYIDRAVAKAKAAAPAITDMVVSANHNESSPDTVGIYGGPTIADTLPVASGIDDYYMAFLVDRIAAAAVNARAAMVDATVHARQVPIPAGVKVRLSDNWPTTDNSPEKPTAIDPKLGVLQARKTDGTPLFTVMSLAAHNQEIGHGDTDKGLLSSDWPGYFDARVQAGGGGTGIFLVGDNGSEEDPITVPEQGGEGTFQQAQATGEALADAVLAAAPGAAAIGAGAIKTSRAEFCVPLENQLFKAAAAAGLFGDRATYLVQGGQCVPAVGGAAPDGLKTSVGLVDVGPDLQLLLHPGEGFPALLLGSPWGFQDVPVECQGRANPPVPTWRAHATHRLQVGLADDFIGYLIPAWAYIGQAGAIATASDPDCNTGSGSTDSAGHHHKLETEGVGPTASNLVASKLTELVTADAPDPTATVVPGRFVLAGGAFSRSPIGATGARLTDGHTVAGPFIDYDGQTQLAPDITTRGVLTCSGTKRVYLDVFPAATPAADAGPLACASATPTPTPTATETATSTATATATGTATATASATAAATETAQPTATVGPPSPTPTASATPYATVPPHGDPGVPSCTGSRKPRLRVRRAVQRGRRLRVRGTTRSRGCAVRRVVVRYRGRNHRAKGRKRWHYAKRTRRLRRVTVIAVDRRGRKVRRVARVRHG